jgi:hypothetical protein
VYKLHEANEALCKRMRFPQLTPDQFTDVVDRLFADGVFKSHAGGAAAQLGGGTLGATLAARGLGGPRGGGRGGFGRGPRGFGGGGGDFGLEIPSGGTVDNWHMRWFRLNVATTDLDAAFAGRAFYARIARDVRLGLVDIK